jgi:hypothetical protein
MHHAPRVGSGPADPVRCGGPMIQFASTACTRAFNPSAARRAWHGGAPARAALVGSTPRFEHHPWVRTCIDLLQPQCDRVAVDANPAHVPHPGSSARSHCDAVQIGTHELTTVVVSVHRCSLNVTMWAGQSIRSGPRTAQAHPFIASRGVPAAKPDLKKQYFVAQSLCCAVERPGDRQLPPGRRNSTEIATPGYRNNSHV